jgi:hypothetical protein
MYEGIRVAVTETEFALEVIADLTVFGQPAFPDDCSQFIQRLSRLLLNIIQLGLDSLIQGTHLILLLLNRITMLEL